MIGHPSIHNITTSFSVKKNGMHEFNNILVKISIENIISKGTKVQFPFFPKVKNLFLIWIFTSQ